MVAIKRLSRVLLLALLMIAGWLALHSFLTIAKGMSEKPRPADLAVVLGTRVERPGTPSRSLRARLERAAQLYRDGMAKAILVSGGLGREGFEEADVMRAYLIAQRVPDAGISVDRGGYDTYETARNAAEFMRKRNLRSVVIVSDYYHLPRAQLAFARFGIREVSAAPTQTSPSLRDTYNILREFVAFYFYLLRDYGKA